MRTISFNQFDGGILNDPRSPVSTGARMVTNFDALTDAFRLKPYRSAVTGDTAPSTSQKQNFCVAHFLPGSTNEWRLFALGVKSGTGHAEVLMKKLVQTGSGNGDLADSTWLAPAANQSSTGNTSFNLFVYYKQTGLIYGARDGSNLWAFDVGTGGGWADSSHALAYTNIAQGLVHPVDDILYVPYDNKIASKNGSGSWNDTALTLPNRYYITSIAAHGNLLAIGCAPLSGVGNSRTFLWDRSSTQVTETIDWGPGVLKVLDSVEGDLVGISIETEATRLTSRVYFREYVGNSLSRPFETLLGEGTVTVVNITKQVIDNRLHFQMSITFNGAKREGVWSVGRKSQTAFSIFHERTPINDTALVNTFASGFFSIGDYLFQTYTDNSNNLALSKTDSTSTFTATSIFETLINPEQPERLRNSAGMRSNKKQIIAILLATEPLPVGASATLKYRVDGGSWTTILTNSTVGSVVQEAFLDASGSAITAGIEYEFRIESTGGAVITELKYKIEVNETLL